jgi:hypothetical protein
MTTFRYLSSLAWLAINHWKQVIIITSLALVSWIVAFLIGYGLWIVMTVLLDTVGRIWPVSLP